MATMAAHRTAIFLNMFPPRQIWNGPGPQAAIWGAIAARARVSCRWRRDGDITAIGRGDRPPREEHIFPRLRLVRQVAQQIRGMVGHDEGNATITVHAAAQAGDG